MNMSNKNLLILFCVSLLFSLNTFAKNNLTFSEKDVELSSEIIGILENYHFTKMKYPSIKTEALKDYIKRLDPNKTIFLSLKGIISNAPGAINLLLIASATSVSGDIIRSTDI